MVHGLRSPKRRKTKEEPRSSCHPKMVEMVIRMGAQTKPPSIHWRMKNAADNVPKTGTASPDNNKCCGAKINKIAIP